MSREELEFLFPGVKLRNGKDHPPVKVPVDITGDVRSKVMHRYFNWDATPLPGRKSTVVQHELNVPGNYRYTLTDKTMGKSYVGQTMTEAAQKMVDDNR